MDDNKVVLFPNIKKDTPPISIEEMTKNISESRTNMAIDLAHASACHIIEKISEAGFHPFKYQESAHDMLFLVECIKSMIMRSCDLDHPFQIIAQDVIEVGDYDSVLDSFAIQDYCEYDE